MTSRLLGGVVAALVLSSAPSVHAAGESPLLIDDLPGYVHVSSNIDGEINGETLVQATGQTVDAVVLDRARSHPGQGRSWRSSDGTTVAIAWVLKFSSEGDAANVAAGMDRAAWQNGTPFDSGLTGAGGVSMSRDDIQSFSVYWRQGTFVVATSVSGPDATRAANDVTLLAHLEADTMQHAVGGVRTTLTPPDSTSTSPRGPNHTDMTWIIAVTVTIVVATPVVIVTLGKRRSPRVRHG